MDNVVTREFCLDPFGTERWNSYGIDFEHSRLQSPYEHGSMYCVQSSPGGKKEDLYTVVPSNWNNRNRSVKVN